jgi:hypothetical protein
MLFSQNTFAQNYTIKGSVLDSSNATLIGAVVYLKGTSYGTSTDIEGNYSIQAPKGKYILVVNYYGYKAFEQAIVLEGDLKLNIVMETDEVTQEVIITDKAPNENVTDTKMGATQLTIEEMKKMPAMFGEVDVVKNVQTLPGVQVAGEGNTGLYVRGGGADQNLILMDEAPIYNAAHLLGIFSIFNSDAVKSVELYKAGIPSAYGGRLSSMLDVRMRSGDKNKFRATGGIGTIASRLTIEGPIIKDRLSYIVSARRTYADLFLKLSSDEDLRKNKLYFYDLNGRVDFKLNDKNSFYVSSYYGRDRFKFGDLFQQKWGNYTFTGNWKHSFSDKLFLNTIYTYSDYKYILGINSGVQNFDYTTGIRENALKLDFNYLPNENHNIHFGISVAKRMYNPGAFTPSDNTSIFKEIIIPKNYSDEGALFVSNKQKISEKITLDYGLRYNLFMAKGPATVYSYNGNPVNEQVIDSTVYSKGKTIKSFLGLEPRLAMRYLLTESTSIKIGYNRNIQFIHQISNSLSPVPFDIWVPSNTHFKPEIMDQISGGVFKNLKDNTYEVSFELYYKNFQNAIDYKDNANILLNQKIETQVLFGKGWSYGAEFFVKKSKGKLTGWISYTLSWSYKKIDGINNGEKYFASYDRRHNLNIIGAYELNDRWDLSASWVFGSGRPIGIPYGGYDIDYIWLGVYPDRNSYRLPAYHRLDVSATLKQKKKLFKVGEGSWNFSIYNVYGLFRINPYTIVAQQDPNDITQRDYFAIYFPAPIPAITYNFKF